MNMEKRELRGRLVSLMSNYALLGMFVTLIPTLAALASLASAVLLGIYMLVMILIVLLTLCLILANDSFRERLNHMDNSVISEITGYAKQIIEYGEKLMPYVLAATLILSILSIIFGHRYRDVHYGLSARKKGVAVMVITILGAIFFYVVALNMFKEGVTV